MVSSKIGKTFEDWVCQQLTKQKYQILATNFRTKYGEIDIIGLDKHTLVIVEVKTRSSIKFGQPYEAVGKKKLNHIIKSGHIFRQKYSHQQLPPATRIDVASVLVNHHQQVINFQLFKNVTR